MKIRSFAIPDLSSLHALNQESVPLVGKASLEELSHIARQSCISLVADSPVLPKSLAGFCLVLPSTADYASLNFKWFCERYSDFIYLDRIAVSEDHRRQGLGRRFYQTVDELAPTRCPSARRLTLEVNIEPRNGPSLAFHEELGFEIVGERDTRYGTKVALMHKLLQSAY